MLIAVGCPVANRAWILEPYIAFIEEAFSRVDLEPHYVFNVGTSTDNTEELLRSLVADSPHDILLTTQEPVSGTTRSWFKEGRFQQMADLRNGLLEQVRTLAPDYFLSIDSDILLHPDALPGMLERIDEFWAVGSKCHMVRGYSPHSPSYLQKTGNGSFKRRDQICFFSPDIIMALKLLTPNAYKVDYVSHPWGEDIGWSLAVRQQGGRLGWDGRVCSKHVMSPEVLDIVDGRVGW